MEEINKNQVFKTFIDKQYMLAIGFSSLITHWIWSIATFLLIVDLKFLEGQITYGVLNLLFYGLILEFVILLMGSIWLWRFKKGIK